MALYPDPDSLSLHEEIAEMLNKTGGVLCRTVVTHEGAGGAISGNCQPSEEDIAVTETLEKVSVIMGIELLDHVIVSRETFFSFLEHKMLNSEKNSC